MARFQKICAAKNAASKTQKFTILEAVLLLQNVERNELKNNNYQLFIDRPWRERAAQRP